METMQVVDAEDEDFARNLELSQSFALRFIQNLQMMSSNGPATSTQTVRSETSRVLASFDAHGSPPVIRQTNTEHLPATPRCTWNGYGGKIESENLDTNKATPRCTWNPSKTIVHGGSMHSNSDSALELGHLEQRQGQRHDEDHAPPVRKMRQLAWNKDTKVKRKSEIYAKLGDMESKILPDDGEAAADPQFTNPALRAWHKDGKRLNDAVKAGDITTVSVLLQKEPTLSMYKGEGTSASCRLTAFTPLHWACAKDHPDIARIIISSCADVNASNRDGVTPLHSASLHGSTECVKVLLSRGADPARTDGSGRTAETCARRKGSDQIVAVFEIDRLLTSLASNAKDWTVPNMRKLLRMLNCSCSGMDRDALEGKVRLFVKPSDKIWADILQQRQQQSMEQIVTSGMHAILHKMQARTFVHWRDVVRQAFASVRLSRKSETTRSRSLVLSALKSWHEEAPHYHRTGLQELESMRRKVQLQQEAQRSPLQTSTSDANDWCFPNFSATKGESLQNTSQPLQQNGWTMQLAENHHQRVQQRKGLRVWKNQAALMSMKTHIVRRGREQKALKALEQTRSKFEGWRRISSATGREESLKMNMSRLLVRRREKQTLHSCFSLWDEMIRENWTKCKRVETEAVKRESVHWTLRGYLWAWRARAYSEGVVKKAAQTMWNGEERSMEELAAIEKELEESRASREHTEAELFHTQEALSTSIALEKQHKESLFRLEASYKGLVQRLILSEEESIWAQFQVESLRLKNEKEHADESRFRDVFRQGVREVLVHAREAQNEMTALLRVETESLLSQGNVKGDG